MAHVGPPGSRRPGRGHARACGSPARNCSWASPPATSTTTAGMTSSGCCRRDADRSLGSRSAMDLLGGSRSGTTAACSWRWAARSSSSVIPCRRPDRPRGARPGEAEAPRRVASCSRRSLVTVSCDRHAGGPDRRTWPPWRRRGRATSVGTVAPTSSSRHPERRGAYQDGRRRQPVATRQQRIGNLRSTYASALDPARSRWCRATPPDGRRIPCPHGAPGSGAHRPPPGSGPGRLRAGPALGRPEG